MNTFSIILLATLVIYLVCKVKVAYTKHKLEKSLFIISYEVVKETLIVKFMEVGATMDCPRSKMDDAETLAKIVFKNLDKEESTIIANPKKFYKKLYKEFKKSNDSFERFINKRFIGISNFLRCYGMTEWNVAKDLVA